MNRVMSWDWKEQIDLDELTQILTELTDGRIHLHNVDTGSDQYAIVLSTEPIDADAAMRLYEETWS